MGTGWGVENRRPALDLEGREREGAMDGSFGEALDDFASSVDIADERVLSEVDDLLQKYLLEELSFDFYEVLLEGWIAGERGRPERALDTRLCKGGRSFPNVAVNSGTTNQTAYCFVKDQPLWITTVDGKPLKGAKSYIDSWSDSSVPDLPQYKSGNRFSIRTSIIQPLRNGQGAFGVINVESSEFRRCNRWAKHEFERIARGVSSIIERAEARKVAQQGTDRSIRRLRNFAGTKRWKLVERPKLFVAYSERADSEVVNAIRKVVERHEDHDVIFWQEHRGEGDIRERMLKGLRESRVIVCYLSEPVENGQYADNPNVLIEAGIAQGFRSAWRDVGLVVVREKGSTTEIPFDLGGREVLKVPRTQRGTLSKRDFNKQFTERVMTASRDQN